MRSLFCACAAGVMMFSAASGVWAADADDIVVDSPFVRLAPPNARATGAFMVLKNPTDRAIKLVKANNNIAEKTELHNHINENGVMKMRAVPDVEVPAKGEAVLKPGSLHIMLIGLKAPMKEGDKVTLELGFADGSSKTIEAAAVARK